MTETSAAKTDDIINEIQNNEIKISDQYFNTGIAIQYRKRGLFSNYNFKFCHIERGSLKIYNSEKDYHLRPTQFNEKIVIRNCRFKIRTEQRHPYSIKIYDVGTQHYLSFTDDKQLKKILMAIKFSQSGTHLKAKNSNFNNAIKQFNERNDKILKDNNKNKKRKPSNTKSTSMPYPQFKLKKNKTSKIKNDINNNNISDHLPLKPFELDVQASSEIPMDEDEINRKYMDVLIKLGIPQQHRNEFLKNTPIDEKYKAISIDYNKTHQTSGNGSGILYDDDTKTDDNSSLIDDTKDDNRYSMSNISLEGSNVRYWIDKIRNPKYVETETLEDLCRQIYENDHTFLIDFISEQGLTLLGILLFNIFIIIYKDIL